MLSEYSEQEQLYFTSNLMEPKSKTEHATK